MWYVLAAANALSGDSDLVAGTSLKVPDTGVAKNDSSTFKPYNPNEIIGSTAPGLPYVPPASGCGAVGMIIMVVIAIVVTVYTAGAAATFFAGSSSVLGAMGASTMATGLAALSGGGLIAGTGISLATGAAIAGAAVGGFVGAVVSQAAGSLMGVANFSWRKAVGSGIASGLTAGIAGAMGGSLSTLMQNSQFGRVAASAALGSMASYAGNEIAGVKNNSFSWKSIAASAVTALVTSKITSKLGEKLNLDYATESGQLTSDLIGNMTGGVVGLHTRRAFGFDDKVDYGMIAADAFGNLIGNSITGKYKYDAMNYAEKINEQATKASAGLQASINNLSPVGQTKFSEQIEAGVDVHEALAIAIEYSGVQSNSVDPQWQLNLPSAAVVYDNGVKLKEIGNSGDGGADESIKTLFNNTNHNQGSTLNEMLNFKMPWYAEEISFESLTYNYKVAVDNFSDVGIQLREALDLDWNESIEAYSLNKQQPNDATVSGSPVYNFNQDEGKYFPETPQDNIRTKTIYMTKGFIENAWIEYGAKKVDASILDYKEPESFDNDNVIQPKRRETKGGLSAGQTKFEIKLQDRIYNKGTAGQIGSANGMSSMADVLAKSADLIGVLGLAKQKSKQFIQVDVYKNTITGKKSFEVTGFDFSLNNARMLVIEPYRIYTNNSKYQNIIRPIKVEVRKP